ncbi:MAG TPA: SgcJ/EcaC family oxidoreductase [Verrucomicrobiales bacterium]|jgi:uncharacterized protein (TIGR02246 family)|nr:SgcJ/EcaC family oxidoreductase [Verrucomicrobiales bacterium]
MSDDERQIRQLIETWLRVSADADFDALEPLMAEDVTFLIPGRPPMSGRETFMTATRANAGQFRMEAMSEVKEIQVAGDFAWCWTHLSVTATMLNDGKVVKRAGNTLSILRRDPDGRWVILRDANLLTVVEG